MKLRDKYFENKEENNCIPNKEVKTYSLSEMKDKYIDKHETKERDEYEYELRRCIGKND